jgi:Rhodopirellula transposase DDE domain
MNREVHVRFWERAGVKFPCATRQHRLFCHITQNWRGRPLTDRLAVVELIGATTTKTGLKVESALDTRSYQKGIKVSKAAMKCLDITGDQFHPEWNYLIRPRHTAKS